MGRRQQSLSPGCGEGEPRSGRHRRDHGEAGSRSQGVPSDPTDRSASMPNCPAIWAAKVDRRTPAASRHATSRRRLPPGQSTRRRSGRQHSPTNGSRGPASVNGRRKSPPGRRSENVGSRPSTRRRTPWIAPKGLMRRERRPSTTSASPSKKDRGGKTRTGSRREGDSRKLSGDPGTDGSVPIVTQIKGPTAHVRPAGALRGSAEHLPSSTKPPI